MDTAIDVLQKIWGVYKEIKDGQDQFHATYSRLQELLEQLRDMEARDALVQSQLLTKYVGIARRFLAYLQRYSERNFLSKVIKQGQMLEAVAEFNEELEALFQTFHLAMGAHIVEKGRLQEEQMNELMRGVRILLQGKDTSGERWTKQEDDSSEHHAILTRMCSQVNLAQASSDFHALIWFLRNGEDEQKEQAALALWELCDEDASHIDTLVDLECIEPLVSLLIAGTEPSKVYAAKALRCITVDEDKEAAVVNAGAIPMLVALLRSGSPEQKDAASGALWNVSCMMRHKSMVSSAGAIPLLVNLLRSGSDAQKWHAASALRELAMDARCRVMIAAAGGIVALIKLLHSGTVNQCDAAVEALWNLSLDEKNKRQIASVGGIEALVEQVKSGETDEHRQRAASALTVLAQDDMNDIKIGAAGGIEALVLLLRDGNEGQKNSAAWALSALTDNDDNKRRVVAADGISVLLSAISGGSVIQAEKAVHALRDVTELEENHGAVVENGVIVALVTLLEDVASTPSQKQHAAHALFHLSKNSDMHSMFVVAVAPLVACVKSEGDAVREFASGCLKAICGDDEDIHAAIVEEGGIEVLLQSIRGGTEVEKANSVGCLYVLSDNGDFAGQIASLGAIEDLLNLLRGGNQAQQEGAAGVLAQISMIEEYLGTLVRCNAIEAAIDLCNGTSEELTNQVTYMLSGLSDAEGFCEIVGACNGLEPILEVLRAGSEFAQESASLVLGCLAEDDDIMERMVDLEAIDLYVELVSSSNARLSEHAAFALRNLAWENTENQAKIVEAGGMEALVEVLKTSMSMTQKDRTVEVIAWLCVEKEYAIRMAPLAINILIQTINEDNSDNVKDWAVDSLIELSRHRENAESVVNGGGIEALLRIAETDVETHQKYSLDCLSNLAREVSVCPKIVEADGVRIILDRLRNGPMDQKRVAVEVIVSISYAEVGQPFVDAGAIEHIVEYMKQEQPSLRQPACGALENFAEYCPDSVKIILDAGAVESLVQVLKTGAPLDGDDGEDDDDNDGDDDNDDDEDDESEDEEDDEEGGAGDEEAGDDEGEDDDESDGDDDEDEDVEYSETLSAADTLAMLCKNVEFGAIARDHARVAGVVQACVEILSSPVVEKDCVSVLKLLGALSLTDGITTHFVAAGAIAELLAIATDNELDDDVCEEALAVLATFTGNRPCRVLLQAMEVVDTLLRAVKKRSKRVKKNARLVASKLQADAF
ncbi:hypothetical protein Poli38472_004758 [Pythium oligandrum]|uniref:Uncharacterized protein n=1 Tax=Pythium oligandrum TaxID=41045 RepID=A0A8K1CAW8_PYTOL|nr:hypothetical protein Poli38472_004758 [Pythium oligandrum]|eukprot:TMW59689.1 hypothetical protein Poli38472_004758 [Pythium oligandrum]